MSGRVYDVTVLPGQAQKIADVATKTGAAVGLSQSGSSNITIHTVDGEFSIDAQGEPIENKDQESFSC